MRNSNEQRSVSVDGFTASPTSLTLIKWRLSVLAFFQPSTFISSGVNKLSQIDNSIDL